MARNKLHPIPHPPRTPVLGNMLTVDGGATSHQPVLPRHVQNGFRLDDGPQYQRPS